MRLSLSRAAGYRGRALFTVGPPYIEEITDNRLTRGYGQRAVFASVRANGSLLALQTNSIKEGQSAQMKAPRIMDRCLECIGLPVLPAVPMPEHLEALGRARLPDGSTVTCFACTTCGLRWAHNQANGWRRASSPDAASEATRALNVARFADSSWRS